MTRESEISGVVLDAIGGPIPGARINARAHAAQELAATSISTDSGEFRLGLPAGSWQLSVEADGYAGALHEVYAPSAGVRLHLSPQSVIAGRVVSRRDHQPVAGVTVTAKKSDGPPYSLLSTVSDAAGAFELRPLPAGTHHLEALSADFRGERLSVDVGPADTARGIELEVTRASTVQGEIRVGGAACAAGMLELLGPSPLSAGADEAGKVQIQGVLPGSYELLVTCPSALPFRERLVVEDVPIGRSWELDTGIVVRGSVETASGRPLPEAVITWTRRQPESPGRDELELSARRSSCVSDVRGEFACSGLEPGHYDGAITIGGELQSAAPGLHVQGHREPPRQRLRADRAAAIRVEVDGGTSAPRAAIAVFACSDQREPVLARRDGEHFLVEGLPLGTYGVHVGASDCRSTSDARVTLVRDGQVVDVSLPLPRLARVRGRLVDAAGAPIPDAWVRASDAHPAWALLVESSPSVMTDGEGEFTLTGLLPGRYHLVARGPFDAGAARQNVDLAPGDDLELSLVLEPPAPAENTSSPIERHATNNTK